MTWPRRLKEWLDPLPDKHRELAKEFEAAMQADLWQIAPRLGLAAALLFGALSVLDALFYPDRFGTMLVLRLLQLLLCGLAAGLARWRANQGSLYPWGPLLVALLLGLTQSLLVVSQDPQGSYLLTMLLLGLVLLILPWSTLWTALLSALSALSHLALGLFLLPRSEDGRAFLLSSLLLGLCWPAFCLLHRFLRRLRWDTFLNYHRLESVSAENASLYEEIIRFNEQLEEQIRTRTQDLREAYNQLECLDQNKSDFIHMIAHELRTPMTVFGGYSQMLLADPAIQQDRSLAQMVGNIRSSSRQLQEIVNTMLDVVKLESGVFELAVEPVLLSVIFYRLQQLFEPVLLERHLSLKIDPLEALPAIEGDAEALYKVFYNLVINSIKYTPDGGHICVSGQIRSAEANGLAVDAVELVVQDSGIGIDPQHHELVFTKFYRADDTDRHSSGQTKFKGGGPGLGLAIARGIVQAHGGRIWIESTGRDERDCPGSCFYVLLPRQQSR
ncbi:MAG: HAMP domain-containing histidine kinase [Chloroflexia bacterium]|nr:HAMP domain-containing histidine kinase [Chloroflexia bacterium]